MVLLSKVAAATPRFSGKKLFHLLFISLGCAALILDWSAQRLTTPWVSVLIPFGVSALVVLAVGHQGVPLLRRLKAAQIIREDGPQTHLKKAGTPTMGGVFFVPVALGLGVLFAQVGLGQISGAAIATLLLTLILGSVGWLDDWQVLRRQSNKGISARLRLGIELACGLGFGLWWLIQDPSLGTLQFPLGLSLSIGLGFCGLAAFVVAAESNAVNLTDGMDGLAAGACAIALLSMAVIVAPQDPSLMVLAACMSGGCMGFLGHNYNPARVFMGDTGSLALGGMLAALGLVSNSLWALLILSGLFLVESLSVIAQVAYYKATKGPDGIGKRLFKMSPLHNHFELSGWPEVKVVGRFYAVVGILALVALGLQQLL
ncbi:phospho-N-acetylmuramoyl-pentapeptide-transferase [Synechococcales cyanobacterium C]|uniref:Phospho-N-acetylmuramoyl-pentapeptide-transferase n=1 Tax=Petrachloros mirabilis ULC683 TaxID=2781853 RepID=A0A8K2A780_9CYAN|nr:phospho-N-acetylmuramoyl-pentapeptide-transferase [Petrachloros mirabilis ULC683]